jgi:hypothetical protein
VADDRRVAEQEERLGYQGQEGGYGEPQDLAVVGLRRAPARDPESPSHRKTLPRALGHNWD